MLYWPSDCGNSFINTIFLIVDREFEEVSTQQMGDGGWRVQVAGPVLGWLLSFCLLLLFCCFLNDWLVSKGFSWTLRRYYAEPVENGIPYSVKGYRGSARLYSVQVSKTDIFVSKYGFTCLVVSGSRRWGRVFEHNGQRWGGRRWRLCPIWRVSHVSTTLVDVTRMFSENDKC